MKLLRKRLELEKKKRKVSFYSFSILIRLVIIFGLIAWIFAKFYPRIVDFEQRASAPPPSSSTPADTIQFIEPENLNIDGRFKVPQAGSSQKTP